MDDALLLERLEACTLSRDEWTHRLHVRTAWLFLQSHPFAAALERVRTSIQRLNRSNDVPEGRDSGFHETLTEAWLRIVADRSRRMPGATDSEAFCDANPELLDKHLLRAWYSPERIGSWEAKRGFVEPDLQPLPALEVE